MLRLSDNFYGDMMKRFTKLVAATVVAAGVIATTAAHAHAIWFAERASQLALINGLGADDLDVVKSLPLITSIEAFDGAGASVPTKLEVNGPLVLVDTTQQPAIVATAMNNGLWSKTPDGKFHRKGKDEVPDAILSKRTYKYAVHLRTPLAGPLPLLRTQRLQIVPVNIPVPQMQGEPMKLRILFDGKPAAGAIVLRDLVTDPDGEQMKTAADGTVTIKLRNQGLNVITAAFDGPSEDPGKTTKNEYTASLSFVLPHKPD